MLHVYRPPVESQFQHPAESIEGRACGVQHASGWQCSRHIGHNGRHEAGIGDGNGISAPEMIVASW